MTYNVFSGTLNPTYFTYFTPSGIRAGLAGGLLLGVASVFTLVTGR